MLHPFFIFLLSFAFFNLDVENLLGKKTHASSILILPEKRPHITNDYNYSLGTINDMILKEGGKTIGKILKQKIKKNENLHLFLKRVGFENKQANAITSKIKSDHPSINILICLSIMVLKIFLLSEFLPLTPKGPGIFSIVRSLDEILIIILAKLLILIISSEPILNGPDK